MASGWWTKVFLQPSSLCWALGVRAGAGTESAQGARGSGECGAAGVCGWWPPDNLLLVTSSRARQRGRPAWAEDGDIAFSLVTKTKNNHQRTKGCGAVGVTGSHRWWQWERVAGFMLHAVAQGQSSPEHFGLWVLSKAGTAAVLAGSRFPGAFLRTGSRSPTVL